MTKEFVSEAFVLIAELAMARGCPMPISEHPGAYEMQIDADWFCAINGRREPLQWRDCEMLPFSAVLEYRGLPAGIIQPNGGCLVAADPATEDNLILALERAIELEKPSADR